MKLLTAAVGAVTVLWIIQPVFWAGKKEQPKEPVRVMAMERDVETLVFGADPQTDFVPVVYTGGLVISPEEDFYNSLELIGALSRKSIS